MKKYLVYISLLAIISCNKSDPKVEASSSVTPERSVTLALVNNQVGKEISWKGFLNGKTPVFIHYQLDGNIIVGEITYLNTKNKLPITLVGTTDSDNNYRILEFEKSGNITGVITGKPAEGIFKGSWFSPKTRKELTLNLVKKDTVLPSKKIETKLDDVFGHYHYQYSEAGYQGDLVIRKFPDSKAVFGITSVTGDPARNLAQIDDDTIDLKTTNFTYKLADTDDCEFNVKFYKGFAVVQYTQGVCSGQFGMNATIEGIYMKTK
ncbi:hypothetical protein BBH99_13690 [Chryseobacterium contaminans]|uniref:Lipoprotein n=1 Tax=Chryseobacterium contaminans TaxID=1423959 RepID=A0A1M6XJ28_9FLAO|nr:hypothetical protein [Chryseobacterium contaminans]OCA71848.1 hypothetical protein BBH99_13690 [Chryseobacterium contaminans]SHL05805.1 hypothetical protein SAMN05444407_10288 [Chryseobacterium contaminans]